MAADEDTLRVAVNVRDSLGTGNWDAWPDTVGGMHTAKRIIIDTLDTWIHTASDSTLLDHGDNQYDTVFIAIAAPIIRLSKTVSAPSGKILPGDTLTYTIVYDNDGSAETRDTANIIDMLPLGVQFVQIDSLQIDSTQVLEPDSIDVDYRIGSNASWNEYLPTTPESLMRVTGLRFQIPPGIGAQSGDAADKVTADDSSDTDAGFMRFSVRIR